MAQQTSSPRTSSLSEFHASDIRVLLLRSRLGTYVPVEDPAQFVGRRDSTRRRPPPMCDQGPAKDRWTASLPDDVRVATQDHSRRPVEGGYR